MTEREIEQRVDRMVAHLDHLLATRNISEESYHAAILDLSKWEEDELLKIHGEQEGRGR